MHIAIIPYQGRLVPVDIETGDLIDGVRSVNALDTIDDHAVASIEVLVQYLNPPDGWQPGEPLIEAPPDVKDVL